MNSHKQQRRWADSDSLILESPSPIPVRTTFRHMPPSPAVAARVNAEAQKLRRYFERIKHCHVVIVAPHRHHRFGQHYAIHMEIGVPRSLLVINHEPAAHPRLSASKGTGKKVELDPSHKDIYVVVREVFDAARRRIEDYVRLKRGDVKRHRAVAGTSRI